MATNGTLSLTIVEARLDRDTEMVGKMEFPFSQFPTVIQNSQPEFPTVKEKETSKVTVRPQEN